jgi:hypothetical protein
VTKKVQIEVFLGDCRSIGNHLRDSYFILAL